MDIDGKINSLSEEDKEIFDKTFLDYLYNNEWCNPHDLKYGNQDIQQVKEITYGIIIKNNFFK